jgi:hypothetical protein
VLGLLASALDHAIHCWDADPQERRYAWPIAPTPQAEAAWTEHANELAAGTLLIQANSWFVGANIPGKKRAFLLIASPSTTLLCGCQVTNTRVLLFVL